MSSRTPAVDAAAKHLDYEPAQEATETDLRAALVALVEETLRRHPLVENCTVTDMPLSPMRYIFLQLEPKDEEAGWHREYVMTPPREGWWAHSFEGNEEASDDAHASDAWYVTAAALVEIEYMFSAIREDGIEGWEPTLL